MKKIHLYLVMVLGLLVITSCRKQEYTIDLTEVNSGDLKIQVADNNGNGIADLTVYITNGSLSSIIEQKATDANGNVTFSKLLSGTYYLIIKSVVIDDMEYFVQQGVQVLNSGTREYNIEPTTFVGSAVIKVRDWFDNPVPDVNVGIFINDDFGDVRSFDEILDKMEQITQTNQNGEAIFDDIPFGSYGVFVYEDSVNFDINYYVFNIYRKGQEIRTFVNYNN